MTLIGRRPPHPMDRKPEHTGLPVVVVDISRSDALVEAMTAVWSNALDDDFARMPAETRDQWRHECTRWYGMESYADLRYALYGDE